MLSEKIPKIFSLLIERQQRLYFAMEAEDIGHGGVLIGSQASGIYRKTIINGKRIVRSSRIMQNYRELKM